MNIFLLSWIVEQCVTWCYDTHVVKMPTETAQLLSTVWWLCEPKKAEKLNKKGLIYKKISNHNHGSAIWARETVDNYKYLIDMGIALCVEYTYRYDRRHKCQDMIEWFKKKDRQEICQMETLLRFTKHYLTNANI